MVLISILGPTSSGKSDIALNLALEIEKIHGDQTAVIISCDSRQVYKDLNLGTGKIEGLWTDFKLGKIQEKVFLYKQIPHFLIDFVDLCVRYSLHDYIKDYLHLFQRWKEVDFVPKYVILCGGTGLFAKAIAQEYELSEINPKFESQIEQLKLDLNQKNTLELQIELSLLWPEFKLELNHSDQNNPRRLINFIVKRIAIKNNWILEKTLQYPKFENKFEFYLNPPDLQDRLKLRLESRFESGMIQEVTDLVQNQKLDKEKLLELGLEYREFWSYYQGLHTLKEFKQNVYRQNWQYIRRQMIWFNKQVNLVKIQNLQDILKTLRT